MSESKGSAASPDSARGLFLGDLAHDLSTPLTAIHGATELLLAGTYGPIDGEQRTLLLEVLASAREMRGYVQDVADLGALETGRLVFASAPVDVGALVREIGAPLTDAAGKRAVTLSIDTQIDVALVESDERRIKQVLTAIFGYAVKASRRGSQIAATVSHRDGRLHAEVRSTGITANEPSTLFVDRRDRTPGVPKPYRGPGLGLPLISRVVAAWGGRVSAETRDGALVLAVDLPAR